MQGRETLISSEVPQGSAVLVLISGMSTGSILSIAENFMLHKSTQLHLSESVCCDLLRRVLRPGGRPRMSWLMYRNKEEKPRWHLPRSPFCSLAPRLLSIEMSPIPTRLLLSLIHSTEKHP